VAAGLTALAVVCCLLYLALRGGRYDRSDLGPDSRDVREALAVLRSVAGRPEDLAQHLSRDATPRARAALEQVVGTMAEAESVDYKEAAWFGDYLRVGVSCPRADGGPVVRYFLLKEERGELRLTGLQL